MKSLKGTKTEKNLMAAFAGESQARNRYTYFASKAKEEGFFQISLIFEETANQEKEHAKRFFNHGRGRGRGLGRIPLRRGRLDPGQPPRRRRGREPRVEDHVPRLREGRPRGGLRGDREVFEAVVVAERQHAKRYEKLAVQHRFGQSIQVRREDGLALPQLRLSFEGMEPPKACPACAHPQAYFELLGENW